MIDHLLFFFAGEIIGWLTAISNALFAVICFLVTLAYVDNCSLFHEKMNSNSTGNSTDLPKVCSNNEKTIYTELTLLIAIVCLAYVYMGYKCVLGVRQVSKIFLTIFNFLVYFF